MGKESRRQRRAGLYLYLSLEWAGPENMNKGTYKRHSIRDPAAATPFLDEADPVAGHESFVILRRHRSFSSGTSVFLYKVVSLDFSFSMDFFFSWTAFASLNFPLQFSRECAS